MSDPAIQHLTKVLTRALDLNPGLILVDDGGDWWEKHTVPADAARIAEQVDGVVRYHIGKVAILALYDGPYSEDNAEEIILDCNQAAEKILGDLDGAEPEADLGQSPD